eukprot:gene10207-13733_t
MKLFVSSFFLVNVFIVLSIKIYPIQELNNLHSHKVRIKPLKLSSVDSDISVLNDDIIKIFGRLSDKLLLLDIPGAGTPEMMNCCHGGCDNCNYSHVFDSMAAGRAKWIALYKERQLIDGRHHSSPWINVFTNSNEGVSEKQFINNIQSLPYKLHMGPSLFSVNNDPPSDHVIQYLYQVVLKESMNATDDDTNNIAETSGISISAEKFFRSLSLLTGEQHGIQWNEFRKLFSKTVT